MAAVTTELYASPNGDRWFLVRDQESGEASVRHEPNAGSGGSPTLIGVAAFLRRGGSGPERQELLRLIGTAEAASPVPPDPSSSGDATGRMSEAFRDAFLNAYAAVGASIATAALGDVFGNEGKKRWLHHLAWQDGAVLRQTAKALGLTIAAGEPLRLGAVFTDENAAGWHPIRVAIEHENDAWTMENEIRVLLAVRAPLKVGITYSLTEQRSQQGVLEFLTDRVRHRHAEAAAVVGEDPATEYLFLVGIERPQESFALDWVAMAFSAGRGAGTASFLPIGPLATTDL